MATQTAIPKGTRDFLPHESIRRNFIFDTIRSVFRLYGYQPIETPAIENLSTLLGKYGEEGDRLIFRILNSGNFLSNIKDKDYTNRNSNALAAQICEKGLRYDLTVPFARFVVQHRNEITFPFKRYQIQPVWRADRPQKGRYREFFQCDVDVIGSDSLLNETELIQIINDVFTRLNIRIQVLLNNRKILTGIAQALGVPDKLIPFTVAIDKIEKIGKQGVIAELKSIGLTDEGLARLVPLLEFQSTNQSTLAAIEQVTGSNEIGKQGISELRTILENLHSLTISSPVVVSPSLARGLSYYTGAIIEAKALDVPMGSICGGGRYDDLTGIFGLPGVSGVGVSFGAERIYDILNELDGFPANLTETTQVMFINFGEPESRHCLALLDKLHKAGISAELYPVIAKIKKQFAYANTRKIPFVAMIGAEEMQKGLVTIKNMQHGDQKTLNQTDLLKHFT